jgi:hypothetical protein
MLIEASLFGKFGSLILISFSEGQITDVCLFACFCFLRQGLCKAQASLELGLECAPSTVLLLYVQRLDCIGGILGTTKNCLGRYFLT